MVAALASFDNVPLVVLAVVSDVFLVLLALVALTTKMLKLRAIVFWVTEMVDVTLV